MKKSGLLIIPLALVCTSSIHPQSNDRLWYRQPAEFFEETLVLGNGRMGVSVFGGVPSDKIFLNDITLWSGEPVDAHMNPDAHQAIPAIREVLKNENYKLADELQRKVQGKFSESYAPLGTLFIHFHHAGTPDNYYRELNIREAVSKIRYEAGGVRYTREYFVSHPDPIMAIRLTAGRKGMLSFDIRFDSQLRHTLMTESGILQAKGRAPVHSEPDYRGKKKDAVVFDDDRGTRFTFLSKIVSSDGAMTVTDSTIGMRNATEAVILVSVATSFNGFDRDPSKEGLDDEGLAADPLEKASFKSYKILKKDHVKDHQTYFNRVSLNLGKTSAPDLATDERLRRYAEGHEDRNLEILYFQYGRYLLISSSRTMGVPANLQGIWNPYIRPPWSSNYTININAEENYWPAENANLPEMHAPLLSFIRNISETGRITARTFFGTGGWAACHNSDIWAMSNPVGNFGEGDPVWANWYMGGAWLSTHLWEHYLFTQDKTFLRDQAYEIMKGAARFCLEWLVEDQEGRLITSPCTSPENRYVTPEGYHGATLYGGTADLAMVRECMEQTMKASRMLDADAAFRDSLELALSLLHPYQIGKKGQLMEWYHDWEDQDPRHRHQSHLFGLYPGHQITPEKTPELAEACRRTLEIKGDETTGWSKGWRINLWARLRDGNRAYKMYRELLRYVEPDGRRKGRSGGGGTYPNLFDAHPPFQIDGNFGGTAAVVEMLMQSNEKEIRLLPALPDAWDSGSVKGICARGGFVVSMEWKNKIPQKIKVFSREGGTTTLIYGDRQREISMKKNQKMELDWQ
ncbi:glycoside hydrolase family 95 protein [bacterium]|nr:glycoside hydrolase family 95 protein [bacterium]